MNPLDARAAMLRANLTFAAGIESEWNVRDAAPEEPRSRSLYRTIDRLPPWLVSLVVHLMLIIVLGLLVIKSPVHEGPLRLTMESGDGSESGASGSFEELLPATTEIVASRPTSERAIVVQPAVLPTDIEIPNLESPQATVHLESGASLLAPNDRFAAEAGSGDGTGDADGGSGAGSGNGTTPTRTQVFGLVEEARSFVYVFDRSDSMNSVLSYSSGGSTVFSITPLEAAKAKLLRSLDDLDRKQRFQIVFYNNQTWLFGQDSASRHLLVANRENKQRAKSFVTATTGEGGTYHMQPLEIAMGLRPDAVFLLTDGEAKDDPTPSELSRLRAMNRGRSRINVIHFCFVARPDSSLVQLAKDNRGQHLSFNLARLGPGFSRATNGAADPRTRSGLIKASSTRSADPMEPWCVAFRPATKLCCRMCRSYNTIVIVANLLTARAITMRLVHIALAMGCIIVIPAYAPETRGVEPQKSTTDEEFGTTLNNSTGSGAKLTPACRKSIDRGTRWLLSAQRRDGALGSDIGEKPDLGCTAIGGLTLLAQGNTPQMGPHRDELRHMLDYVLLTVDRLSEENDFERRFTLVRRKIGRNADLFLASLFLSQTLGECQDYEKDVRAALVKLVDIVCRTQRDDGTWGDESWAPVLGTVLGWECLRASNSCGLKVDASASGAGGALFKNLKGQTENRGDWMQDFYKNASSVRVLYSLNYRNDPVFLQCVDRILQVGRTDDRPFVQAGGEEYLAFFLVTECLLQERIPKWQEWYPTISDKIMRTQNQDGSWSGHHCIKDRTFCTAAALLTLQAPNLYLPISSL